MIACSILDYSPCVPACLSSSLIFFHGNIYAMINPYNALFLQKTTSWIVMAKLQPKSLALNWQKHDGLQLRRRTYSPPSSSSSSSRSGLYWRPHQNFTSVAHCVPRFECEQVREGSHSLLTLLGLILYERSLFQSTFTELENISNYINKIKMVNAILVQTCMPTLISVMLG